jgi:hypothetical protein
MKTNFEAKSIFTKDLLVRLFVCLLVCLFVLFVLFAHTESNLYFTFPAGSLELKKYLTSLDIAHKHTPAASVSRAL